MGHYANSADPDQMPQSMSADQGLHCFLTERSMKIWIEFLIPPNNPSNGNGLIQLIRAGKSIWLRRVNNNQYLELVLSYYYFFNISVSLCFSLTVGLWPVWGPFTPLILVTLFMGFIVTIAMLPNFWYQLQHASYSVIRIIISRISKQESLKTYIF